MSTRIAVMGAGRMGEGIALAFIYAGNEVALLDFKQRSAAESELYHQTIKDHLQEELNHLVGKLVLSPSQVKQALGRLIILNVVTGDHDFSDVALAFEAVPEVKALKADVFAWASEHLSSSAIIASTTSTFLVTDLAGMVRRPERFMNAHWLNPAHLMPLVEVSRGPETGTDHIDTLFRLLRNIGKVPVLCNAAPGYIVPRIQVLIMNEAARLVEEGVASAADVDTAIRVGLGLRYSVLGALEFIDWGGGDTLYYASEYLQAELDPRFRAPDCINENMQQNRRGFRDGIGFFDYKGVDISAHRKQRVGEFIDRLELSGLMPRFSSIPK